MTCRDRSARRSRGFSFAQFMPYRSDRRSQRGGHWQTITPAYTGVLFSAGNFSAIMPGNEQGPGPYWRPQRKIGGPVLFLVLLAGVVVLALALAGFLLAFFG